MRMKLSRQSEQPSPIGSDRVVDADGKGRTGLVTSPLAAMAAPKGKHKISPTATETALSSAGEPVVGMRQTAIFDEEFNSKEACVSIVSFADSLYRPSTED